MYQNVPLQRLQIQLVETEKPVFSFHNGMSWCNGPWKKYIFASPLVAIVKEWTFELVLSAARANTRIRSKRSKNKRTVFEFLMDI